MADEMKREMELSEDMEKVSGGIDIGNAIRHIADGIADMTAGTQPNELRVYADDMRILNAQMGNEPNNLKEI